jgi:hypothetical protein
MFQNKRIYCRNRWCNASYSKTTVKELNVFFLPLAKANGNGLCSRTSASIAETGGVMQVIQKQL